jgi:hypothetical protein
MVSSPRDDSVSPELESGILTNGAAIAASFVAGFDSVHLERAMNFKYGVLAVPAFAFCACRSVSTNAALVDPSAHFAKTCPAAVKLFTTPERVQQPYHEVALISSRGQTSYSSEGDMINSMREKAARVGANGIILNGIDEPSAMAKVTGEVAQVAVDAAGMFGTISAERNGRAMAIYIPADSTRTITACPDRKK